MKILTELQVKQISVNLLSNFDKFCKENGIEYFLAYGTLLGAVRHGGFIPWDDDIDISMTRHNYQKFLELSTNAQNFNVLSPFNDKNYIYDFIKVCDKETFVDELFFTRLPNLGIFLDVFPIDGLSNCKENNAKLLKKVRIMVLLRSFSALRKYVPATNFLKGIAKRCLYAFSKLFNPNYISRRIDKMSQKYNNEDGECCAYIGSTYKAIFKKVIFDTNKQIKFEDGEYPAPADADMYLKAVYKDYMKLPPIEKQVKSHNNQAYLK